MGTRKRRAAKKRESLNMDEDNVHHDLRGPPDVTQNMASAPITESTLTNLNTTRVVSTAVVSESSFVTSSPASLAKKRRTEQAAASLPLNTSIDMTAIASMQPPVPTATAMSTHHVTTIGESVAPKKRGRIKATDSQIEEIITDKANERNMTSASGTL